MRGKILKGVGGFYYVLAEDGVRYECRARGIFRKDGEKPLVGDEVRIDVIDAEAAEGSIAELLPRKSALIRPEAANLDQALLVFSFTAPDPNPLILDRFLIMLKRQEIPCILLFNKRDLVKNEEAEALLKAYERAGAIHVEGICAREEGAAEKLGDLLRGKSSWLAGPSGVGKTTILNCLCPSAKAETGEISKKLRRGKNTTRHSELFPIEGGGYLCDTPGFTSLELYGTEAEEICNEYPEFSVYAGSCRFRDCMHIREPGCAVREAAESGAIPMLRYRSYCSIYEKEKEKSRY
ncbi:MAG: ribosome small subunit-dependent GTPase A [Lachnospiraceae bacterium]|nr:ribosome small subunit-dependent GTPase A [Lachnospiraceae bacterium]